MTNDQTRRTVLKTGAAVGSLAVVGSMAGCSSLLGGGGSADYTNWLYAPGAVGDSDHYFFTFIDDQEIRDNEDSVGEYNETEQVSDFPLKPMGVDYDAVNTRIGTGLFASNRVVMGSFSESDVVDELQDNEFEEGDEYEGYTSYVKEQEGNFGSAQTQLVAVNGSTAIGAQSFGGSESLDPQDVVEALVDADAGNEDRYVDENDDMALLVDEFGDSTSAFGGTQDAVTEENASVESGSFVGQVAGGQAATIDGDTTESTYVRVFADSSDIDTDTIEEWTDNSSQFENLDNIEVSESGRAVIVTGEQDTDEVFNQSQS